MKKIYILCMLFLLASCQQPTVYVYTENLDAQKKSQLELALRNQSLPYEYVQLDIPREFSEATLMLSQDKILTHEAEQLGDIMLQLGYQPVIKYITEANHVYKNGNIGFYLKEPSEQGEFSMPSRVLTTGCDEDKFNDLVVTFTDTQAEFTLRSGTKVVLNWEYLYGYLVIYYKNYSQTYAHSQPFINTPFGEKPSDTYWFTARVNEPSWLNCSLQIVYMD
ncbi:hypothetical protein LY624_00980 [Pseudoalteromonas sp. N1230-9]|uniref:hypothetical protein n=1 Tax=unclassified Pseudoalteromonas TaxID=194690 RepID=UPI00102391C7|nr:hypothetical protein EXT42_13835 [Pseudoalteromonas sp. CO302Y]RZG06912.1 hypothetical protein EXT40_14615 [Pseudoalteromonas sp. CO133X]WOC26494.1 hypothetical protein LY624_00980 [Pseudoalteromonas sp. N1230-9]